MLEDLPDGIHSGLLRKGESGIFLLFHWLQIGKDRDDAISGAIMTCAPVRFWINRFLITNLIACSVDTPRIIGDTNAFEIQEKILDDILRSVQDQEAVEAAPKIVDPVQQSAITVLRGYMSSPVIKRQDVQRCHTENIPADGLIHP